VLLLLLLLQVAMIGSGAWACAAMHIVAQNCLAYDVADEFVDEVRMWVYEEEFQVRCRVTGYHVHALYTAV
jgi:glycerol-3-phosphate dehydrogenase